MTRRRYKPDVKGCLERYLEPYDEPIAVLLSAGMDSHAVLFSLLELKKDIVVYSFTLEDRESRDFRMAKKTAEEFGLPFKAIYLPTSMPKVKKGLKDVVTTLGATGKSAIECLWALKYAVDRIDERYITSGLAADIYFVLSKKGCMHYKDCADDYRIPRWKAVRKPGSQTSMLKAYCKTVGKQWLSPWLTKDMMLEFKGTSWDDVNKPQQKQPLRHQYAEYLTRVRVYQHTNLQLGDSGISKLFTQLLDDPKWNRFGYKSMTGIYNRLVAGEL